jgi:hypothetical protein
MRQGIVSTAHIKQAARKVEQKIYEDEKGKKISCPRRRPPCLYPSPTLPRPRSVCVIHSLDPSLFPPLPSQSSRPKEERLRQAETSRHMFPILNPPISPDALMFLSVYVLLR